jgi:hypothetical protein
MNCFRCGAKLMSARLSAVRRLGLEESGLALVLALIVVAAMSISTVALVGLVTSNETAFGRDRQEVRALNIGQSGLNYGVSYMQQYLAANDSSNGLAVGSTVGSSGSPMYSGAVDGGTMSWYAAKTGAATWTIYANAVSPNGAVTRRLSLNMGGNVTTQTTTLTASPVYAYGYVMADPNADCASLTPPANGGDSISNSAALTVPIFIASSLCVSAGAPAIGEPSVEPAGVTQSVTLYVGKTFRTSGTANPVGSSATPILSANIVGGCQVNFHGLQNRVCSTQGSAVSSSGSGVYASTYPVQQQSLVKPTIDVANYSAAMPGPANDCNGTSVKNLFRLDNNAARNTSLGTINLFHLKNTNQADTGNNFDCRYYDGTGNLVGQLTWVDGNPGTLTVKGTIFLDGNLNLSANDKVKYTGLGVIYLDGTLTAANGARFCAGALVSGDCPTTWDTSTNNVELVAINHQNAANAVSFVGDAQVQGIVFANGNFSSTNGASIYGSVIADSGQLSGDAKFASPPQPPAGAPGGPSQTTNTSTTWNIPKGGWSQY